MAQIDDLQAYVNIELPRRRPLLTVAIAGYDDDPNHPSAPTILKNAPVGTWYLRETPLQMYEKLTAGTDTWSEAGAGGGGGNVVTEEDLAYPVDYTDGTAVDPPAGTIFTTQQDIDDFLAANGTSNFKHPDRAYRSLPPFPIHTVDFNIAGGVIRPSGDSENGSNSWRFSGKVVIGDGRLNFNGVSSSSYIAVVGSSGSPLSVNSFDAGSTGNPSLTFLGTPFAGLNLRGRFAILDTGLVTQIHDHDDSTLYVCNQITGTPTTCWVGRPSTIFRNSTDDVNPFTSSPIFADSDAFAGIITFNDIAVEGFGANGIHFSAGNMSNFGLNRSVVDDLTVYQDFAINPNGRPFQSGTTGQFLMNGCAYAAPFGVPGNDALFSFQGNKNLRIILLACYFGESSSATIRDVSGVLIRNTVFDECGNVDVAACDGNFMHLNGKYNEMRGDTSLRLDRSTFPNSLSGIGTVDNCIVFRDMTGPGLTLFDQSRVDLSGVTVGLVDGGGNADVGIELAGRHSSLKLDSATDVTGTNGDVRMADSIVSYTDLETDEYVDSSLNIASKAP